MTGTVLSLDGSQCLKASVTELLPATDESDMACTPTLNKSCICVPAGAQSAITAAENLGTKLADNLLDQGAKEILRVAREQKDSD